MFGLEFGHAEPISPRVALHALILALILTQFLGAVYIWTFRGMSYTRSFVHAIVIGGVITAMLMLAIGDSIAAGLGLAGSLAIIRFRTSVRDPRDMVFIFAAMGAGIACGLHAYATAIAGTAVFAAAIAMLTWLEYGQTRQFDGLLRFYSGVDANNEQAMLDVLRAQTTRFALISMRQVKQGEAMEHAYQVRLGRRHDRTALVHALEAVPGLDDVSVHYQDETVEL